MKLVGKPDAENPHVRFDERGGETEPLAEPQRHRAPPRLYIHQSDVIYYGVNLEDYFEHEFGNVAPIAVPTKHIRFWSDLVDRAFRDPFYPGRATD